MMKKRLILSFMLLACWHFQGPVMLQAEENLLKNPGFEDGEELFPAAWVTTAWNGVPEAVEFRWEKANAYSGERCITINNKEPNDSRVIQRVEVEPNTSYKVTCRTKVSNVGTENAGACLSVPGQLQLSGDLQGTTSDWQLLEVYIRTGNDVTFLDLSLNLGGYASLNTGIAMFDEVSMVKAPLAPDAVVIIVENSAHPPESAPGTEEAPGGQGSTGAEIYLLLGFFLILSVLAVLFLRQPSPPAGPGAHDHSPAETREQTTEVPGQPAGGEKPESADAGFTAPGVPPDKELK